MSERKSANAYRTISEVAGSLGVPQHVLRFWETKFPAVKPLKRGGNRRYYRPEDIEVLQVIHKLLHVDGYTIKGAQKLLKERGVRALVEELLNEGAPETALENPTEEAPTEEAPTEEAATEASPQIDAQAEAEAETEAGAALAEAGIPEAPTAEPEPTRPAPADAPAQDQALDTPQAPQAALVAELKSIRAKLAHALGGAAPAGHQGA